MELEPASGHGHDHRWYGDPEGDEDEDGIRDHSYALSIPTHSKPDAGYIPVKGHIFNSKSVATFLRVSVCVISDFVINAKINSNPPPTAKRRSMTTYVVRILSRAISNDDCSCSGREASFSFLGVGIEIDVLAFLQQ